MKAFRYEYFEAWGEGQGIVIAESIEDAIAMMVAPYSDKSVDKLYPHLKFEEIDVTKPQVFDFTWTE